MARDPHVHFTIYDNVAVEKVKATAYFRSVFGTGIA